MRSLFARLLPVCAAALAVRADSLFLPNDSFELPATSFADPAITAWQKAPQPGWYSDPFFPWEQLAGQFLNMPVGDATHIDNTDGRQAAFLFALPGVGLRQDQTTLTGSPGSFVAQFEAGKAYALTVGLIGGGGGMSNGATFEIALYFRDASNNEVTVRSATITNSSTLFPTNTHFVDFQVAVPPVKATDPWAGKRIGVRLASTTSFGLMGGYWDVDHVRLTESPVPNSSFESPPTDFASPVMDGWQKAPQPGWYTDPFFPWDQLVGQFLNTTNGSADHIVNMDGPQAAFLFALPDVAIFQDFETLGGTSVVPPHDLVATFATGRCYTLSVGLIGGGGGMSNGATCAISLYYLDAATNRVTVVSRTVTNSAAQFPDRNHFVEFRVDVPTVTTNDPWAGRPLGVRIASTVGFDKMGGYWDVDQVRVIEQPLANHSFELPATDFASPVMDGWQKSAQPLWYTDSFPWTQLVGQFLNTGTGSVDHIDNMDGAQAAFLFSSPDVAISQDLAVGYEPGCSYLLSAGLIGGGGGMPSGATLRIRFHYLDASSNRSTVAETTVTNTPAQFPTNTHFTAFAVQTPVIRGSDPWAGRHIGIELAATVGFDRIGGYWDLDAVRVLTVREPLLTGLTRTGTSFQVALQSAPGLYDLLAATNALQPVAAWTTIGRVTNFTGQLSLIDTNAAADRGFFVIRPAP